MRKSFIPATKMSSEPTMKKELINNQVLIDGKRCLFTDILKDPLRYKIFSDETKPMETVGYRRKL